MEDIILHEDGDKIDAGQPIGYREYQFGNVALTLRMNDQMLWRHWMYALRALQQWSKRFEFVDMDFDINVAGTGTVGTARLFEVFI